MSWSECKRPGCLAARAEGALTFCSCQGTGWVQEQIEDVTTAPTVVAPFETMAEVVHGKAV